MSNPTQQDQTKGAEQSPPGTPLFIFEEFNDRRRARDAEAALVEVTWPDGEIDLLWMNRKDIMENAKLYGWQKGLTEALALYDAAESG